MAKHQHWWAMIFYIVISIWTPKKTMQSDIIKNITNKIECEYINI